MDILFTSQTAHLKMRYYRIFSLSEHKKHTKLHSRCRKNQRKGIFKCPVRYVKTQCVQYFADSLYKLKKHLWYSVRKLCAEFSFKKGIFGLTAVGVLIEKVELRLMKCKDRIGCGAHQSTLWAPTATKVQHSLSMQPPINQGPDS